MNDCLDNKLLFIFKKKKITGGQLFYDLTSDYVKTHPSTNRGSATGSNARNVSSNPKTNTAILGYFDKWSPSQKKTFRINKGRREKILQIRR